MIERRRNPKLLGLVVATLLNVLIASFVGWQIIAYQNYPFDSDEARHALRGLALTFDLRRGDIGALSADSYLQDVYPPGLAWLEAPIFLLFGASTITARLCSLMCLIGSTFVIYVLGLELDDRYGWLVGTVAVGLTLTAQAVLVHAALAMIEMLGLLVSLATLLAYIRATKQPSVGRSVIASLLLAFTMLTKYPYGIIVSLTLGLVELLSAIHDFSHDKPGVTARRWVRLFLPFSLVMVAWFAGENKIEHFFYYATLQPKQTDWYGLENLIFYPRSIALHYAPSPVFTPVILGGVVWAAFRWRHKEVRLILLYWSIGMLVMTLKESNAPRFIATIVPAVYLLTGVLVAHLVATLRHQWPHIKPGVSLVALALLLCSLSSLPMLMERFAVLPNLLEVEYETSPQTRELAVWIADHIHNERLYIINPWDQFSNFAMEWYLATQDTSHDMRFEDLFVPSRQLKNFASDEAVELESEIRFYSTRYVVVLEHGLMGQPCWSQYEQALSDTLIPVASRTLSMKLHPMEGWLKTALITRESLSQAQAEGSVDLDVKATIYRIRQGISCTPMETPLKISLGMPDDTAYVDVGWFFAEDIGGVKGRWAGGIPTTTLHACLNPQAYYLRFRALSYPPGQVLTLKVNDVEIAQFSMPEVWTSYTATIPADVIVAGETTRIQFTHAKLLSASERTSGESPDERPLGAAYDWILIEPKDDDVGWSKPSASDCHWRVSPDAGWGGGFQPRAWEEAGGPWPRCSHDYQ
jgi:hypothetical protein